MQLIVISTALCLLVGLVVGLAFNLGDWINEGEDKPDPNGVTQNPRNGEDVVDSGQEQPAVDGADLMLGHNRLTIGLIMGGFRDSEIKLKLHRVTKARFSTIYVKVFLT